MLDLVEAGLLELGDRLSFAQPRKGKVHSAAVAEHGEIVLDDRRSFPTPSSAAAAAAELAAIDGWYAWVADASGVSLAGLRNQLLDVAAADPVATGGDEDEEAAVPASARHDFLKEARERAEAGDPFAVSVRELVGRWGGRARGHRISQRIEADLANHGLVTAPNFRRVTLDATVSLVGTSPPEEDAAATAVADTVVTASAVIASPELAEIGERKIGLTLGNLPSAAGGLVSVKPGATIDEAVTKMLLNDLSRSRCSSTSTSASVQSPGDRSPRRATRIQPPR